MYHKTGSSEVKFGNSAFLKNPLPLKVTTPTVFAAHPSNFAQTLTTKFERSSRSPIFQFASQFFFFATAKSLNFMKKNFEIILNFFRGDRG